jgi:hypothetical protein
VRACKNHLRFGLGDYSQSMPPDSPRHPAAIEVTDARSMAQHLTAIASIPGPDRTGRSALSVRLTFPRLPRANASSTPAVRPAELSNRGTESLKGVWGSCAIVALVAICSLWR